jgi:hypothetical protein
VVDRDFVAADLLCWSLVSFALRSPVGFCALCSFMLRCGSDADCCCRLLRLRRYVLVGLAVAGLGRLVLVR